MWLACLFPGISLLMNRRPGLGTLFLLLQPTIIGWVIGAVVAVYRVRELQQRRQRVSIISQASWAATMY
jgi:hypothetical protein